MEICAVIPAAGLGSRLGMRKPKLLAPVSSDETIWSILREKIAPIVDHINVIASPAWERFIRDAIDKHAIKSKKVSISIQAQPVGMGDAIFCGYPIWSQAHTIVIIWGDQVFVSQDTLQRSLATHAKAHHTITLPLARVSHPYVEYVFDSQHQLVDIKQTREGDSCASMGLSDVGTFILSTQSLLVQWEKYTAMSPMGKSTGELNFLPFLKFLVQQHWNIEKVMVDNPLESRGINTAQDLAFFQQLLME